LCEMFVLSDLNAQLKFALAALRSPPSFLVMTEPFPAVRLVLALALPNVALNAGNPPMTKTVSVKEKGGEGPFVTVPPALLRKWACAALSEMFSWELLCALCLAGGVSLL